MTSPRATRWRRSARPSTTTAMSAWSGSCCRRSACSSARACRSARASLIAKVQAATVGRLLWVYFVIRQIAAALGLTSLGGHAQMVRPLVAPMAEGAAEAKFGALPDRERYPHPRALRGRRQHRALLRRGHLHRHRLDPADQGLPRAERHHGRAARAFGLGDPDRDRRVRSSTATRLWLLDRSLEPRAATLSASARVGGRAMIALAARLHSSAACSSPRFAALGARRDQPAPLAQLRRSGACSRRASSPAPISAISATACWRSGSSSLAALGLGHGKPPTTTPEERARERASGAAICSSCRR